MFSSCEEMTSYYKGLKTVDNIEFTNREIDVISCILNGRTAAKEIANLLFISVKVVETYKGNINTKIKYVCNLNIRDFIEKSDKYEYIRNHFTFLFHTYFFKTTLKKILPHSSVVEPVTILLYREPESNFILGSGKNEGLKDYLELSGFSTNILELYDLKETFTAKIILLILTDKFFSFLLKHPEVINIINSSAKNHSAKIISVTLSALNNNIISKFEFSDHIIFSDNYTESYFSLISNFLKAPEKLSPLITEFKENTLKRKFVILNQSSKIDTKLIYNNNKKLLTLLFLMLFAVSIAYFVSKFNTLSFTHKNQYDEIQDNLIIPLKTSLLERPEIIEKIKTRLKSEKGINAIVLTGIVGIGGAGKTTLARYYGRYISKASVVWELNAETKETLINSMLELAYTLADTIELKKELAINQQIQEPQMREKQLLNFIRLRLRTKSSWLLIYDNIDSINKINNLFPNNPVQWGNGQIIITSRNTYIDKTGFIKSENIISIDTLTDEEKQKLFIKILYQCDVEKLPNTKLNEVKEFLLKIPPFPLDVSLAAYALKNSDIGFNDYLKQINEFDKNYVNIHSKMIGESTNYNIVRYSIISSTIEKIIASNPGHKYLLFFLSLLDSQNILIKLLRTNAKAGDIEDFTYELHRNGLLLKEINNPFQNKLPTFSIHRSTHQNIYNYLKNKLSEEELRNYLTNILQTLKNHLKENELNKDKTVLLLMIPHLESVLNNIANLMLPTKLQNKLEIELSILLGEIYLKWGKSLHKSIKFYKKALEKNEQNNFLSDIDFAMLLKNLGSLYETSDNLEESLKYSTKSIAICKKLKNSNDLIAENLQVIGAVYRKLNNFDKALEYLVKSLNIMLEIKDQNVDVMVISEIYTQLGALYLSKYLHQEEGKLAVDYFAKAQKLINTAEISKCDLARYSWKYSRITMFHELDYVKSLELLREAKNISERECPEDIYLRGRIFGFMGGALLRMNNASKAEEILSESIALISQVVGPNVRWIEYIRRAEARIRLGKYKEAYVDCLHVFDTKLVERNNLVDLILHTNLYHIAFINYKLGNNEKAIEYFAEFIKSIDIFCQDFLKPQDYNKLQEDKAFYIFQSDKKKSLNEIRDYLKRSIDIFKVIYGPEHPFVKDYIIQNFTNSYNVQ